MDIAMYTWIMYDISNDKARRKVAKLCLQLGLQRVQRSVFLGKVKKKHLREFRQEAKKLLDQQTDQLYVLRTSDQSLQRMRQIGTMPSVAVPGQVMFF
jgi:CRISPR-associated protein Cas2